MPLQHRHGVHFAYGQAPFQIFAVMMERKLQGESFHGYLQPRFLNALDIQLAMRKQVLRGGDPSWGGRSQFECTRLGQVWRICSSRWCLRRRSAGGCPSPGAELCGVSGTRWLWFNVVAIDPARCHQSTERHHRKCHRFLPRGRRHPTHSAPVDGRRRRQAALVYLARPRLGGSSANCQHSLGRAVQVQRRRVFAPAAVVGRLTPPYLPGAT